MPLDQVPDEVKLNCALRQSMEERKKAGLDTTLLCEVAGCQTQTGHARQANNLCERIPRACAPCCKRLGGCKKHPLAAADLQNLGRANVVAAESSQTMEKHTPPPTPQHFAQPLPADYGRAFVANHQARQQKADDAAAHQKAQEDLWWSVIIVFWDGSDQPGQITLMVHPEVVQHVCVASGNVVCVFEPQHQQWVSQSIQVPIAVTASSRILLQTLEARDIECVGLNTEIERVSDMGPMVGTHKCTRTSSDLSEPRAKFPKLLEEGAGSQPADTLPTPAVDVSKLPFKYVSSHIHGMEAMLDVEIGILEAFHQAFPSTLFMHSMFYKVQALYRQSKKLGLLNQFAAYGKTEQGLCICFEHDGQRSDNVTPALAVGTTPMGSLTHLPEEGGLPLLYTNITTLTKLHATKECVRFHPFEDHEEDPIEDADGYQPDVTVWLDPQNHFDVTVDVIGKVVGQAKDCIPAGIPVSWTIDADGPDSWWPENMAVIHEDMKQDALVLGEALCIGEAQVWWQRLMSVAFDHGHYIAEVGIADGYMWQDTAPGGLFWYAQEDLGQEDHKAVLYPLGTTGDLTPLEETLNAFTHFAFIETGGAEAFVDFQGKLATHANSCVLSLEEMLIHDVCHQAAWSETGL
ncbi:hypothetical protein K439DRAFT_1620418 [Ramaria rubella]|nr:hypothetical protein K439DRAFT_1620418 [Ramaria rubella]